MIHLAHFVVFAHSHPLDSLLQVWWEVVCDDFPHVPWSSELCSAAQVICSEALSEKEHKDNIND